MKTALSQTTAQSAAYDKLRSLRVGALFMRPGTGKTRVAVDLINSIDGVDLVVWLGPLASVRPRVAATGTAAEISRWGGIATLRMFGIESLSASDRIYLEVRDLLDNARNAALVVDESLKIKNWSARRTRRIIDLGRLANYRLILNGTPFSRNLCDLWPQMQFLSPKILGMTENRFIRTYCEVMRVTESNGVITRRREFVVGHRNMDHLYSLIRPYVYEADLETNIRTGDFEIGYETGWDERARYAEIKDHYLEQEKIEEFGMTCFLAMTQKMQMSYCVTEDKFAVVGRLFTDAIDPAETLIFCKFIESRKRAAEAFPKATVLSLQRDAMSLNLQHFRNIIFWDRTWDWAAIDQAKHRIFRIGQRHDCRFYHLHSDMKLDGLIRENNDRKMTQIQYFNSVSREEVIADV